VKVWDATSGQLQRTLEGHGTGVWSVAWDARGERLAAGCLDGSLWIWDVASDPPRVLVRLYAAPGGGALAITADGLVAGTDEQALDLVRFADRWALYDVTDVPSRVIPFAQIADILRRPPESDATAMAAPAHRGTRAKPRSKRTGAPSPRPSSPRTGQRGDRRSPRPAKRGEG
jgi:hypothetical protein